MAKHDKEPLNELDLFAPITRRIYQDPRWSGKRVPSAAFRVYCWMVDHTTGHHDVEQDDGRSIRFGQVNGEHPVPFATLANDLRCSWREVQRACEWLVKADFLWRGRPDMNAGYIYSVKDSTRKLKGEVKKYKRVVDPQETTDEFINDALSLYMTGPTCPDCHKAVDTCQCEFECEHDDNTSVSLRGLADLRKHRTDMHWKEDNGRQGVSHEAAA